MPRRLKNIRPWKGRWQAYTEIRGKTHSQSFTTTKEPAPVELMRAWLKKERDTFAPKKVIGGSFAADVVDYLGRVKAMPTFKQRAAHLTLWIRALGGDRPRASITPGDIDRIMNEWLTTPTNQPDPTIRGRRGRPSAKTGLNRTTVRKRRTALLSLFVKLDGKTASNPVRGAMQFKDPEMEARGTDYGTLARVLAAMPDYRDTKKGLPRLLNLSKLRATVMAYTGIPPMMLQLVQRSDINLAAKTVRLHGRRKGKGTEARTVPLNAPAVDAFRALIAANALGAFAEGAVNVAFKRACRRVDVTDLHLYDVRHSFGRELYLQTGDLATVGRALGHAPGSKVTHRYTKAAHQAVDIAAAEKMGAAITNGRNQYVSLSQKPVRGRKSRTRKQFTKAS